MVDFMAVFIRTSFLNLQCFMPDLAPIDQVPMPLVSLRSVTFHHMT
jgi:hypothetical protein